MIKFSLANLEGNEKDVIGDEKLSVVGEAAVGVAIVQHWRCLHVPEVVPAQTRQHLATEGAGGRLLVSVYKRALRMTS